MRVPEFVKEVVWSLYPPRYRQLADKPFSRSLAYMSKILLIAFLISGVFFLPRLLVMQDSVEAGLEKFSSFSFVPMINQSDAVRIPQGNPWVLVDLNNNVSLSKEFLVIDSSSVQYRWLNVKKIPREQFNDLAGNRAVVSTFISAILLLMLPGIALMLYIRTWIKYFILILVFGTFFFIISELSRFRLKWKQMLNIAAHALTPLILLEVISAGITTAYLIPVLKFLGVNIYLVSLLSFCVLMIMGIVGYNIVEHRKK